MLIRAVFSFRLHGFGYINDPSSSSTLNSSNKLMIMTMMRHFEVGWFQISFYYI
jgi:hypothetical protein